MSVTVHPDHRQRDIVATDPLSARARMLACSVLTGIVVAGFWNARVVDGFGSDIVANNTIGTVAAKANQFWRAGAGFGFVFALIAGLAATFTACNCVAFAMIPGLACASDARAGRSAALRSLGIMTLFVMLVGGVYGMFVGWLGPVGAAAFNMREIRFAQAGVVFSGLGFAILLWAAIELDLLTALTRRSSLVTRAFFAQPTTKQDFLGRGEFLAHRDAGVPQRRENHRVQPFGGVRALVHENTHRNAVIEGFDELVGDLQVRHVPEGDADPLSFRGDEIEERSAAVFELRIA